MVIVDLLTALMYARLDFGIFCGNGECSAAMWHTRSSYLLMVEIGYGGLRFLVIRAGNNSGPAGFVALRDFKTFRGYSSI